MPVNYYTDTREDTIDQEEYRLYEMIMEYRVRNPPVQGAHHHREPPYA